MRTTKLRKFLFNRNLLETFERNLINNGSYDSLITFEKERKELFIFREAFVWIATPEGYYFWLKIHNEWIKSLKHNLL